MRKFAAIIFFLTSGCMPVGLHQNFKTRPDSVKTEPEVFSAQTFKIQKAETTKDIQSLYCSGDKQSQALRFNAVGVLPAPARGTPADQAAEIQKGQREFLRNMAKYFFLYGSLPRGSSLDPRNFYRLYQNPHEGRNTGRLETRLTVLPTDHPRTFIEGIKNTPFGDCYDFSEGRQEDWYKGCPTFVYFSEPRTLVMTITGLPTLRPQESANLFSGTRYFLKSYQQSRPYRLGNVFVTVADKKTIRLADDPNFSDIELQSSLLLNSEGLKKAKNQIPSIDIYSVKDIVPSEGPTFLQNYTMLIPLEIQKKVFSIEWDETEVSRLYPEDDFPVGYYLKADKKTFNLKKAIEWRHIVWEAYLDRFTSVEESSGEDPQEMKFEVNVDLNLFCKYGQPISNLQSR